MGTHGFPIFKWLTHGRPMQRSDCEENKILDPNFGKLSKVPTEVCFPKFVIKVSVNFNKFKICNSNGLVKSTKFLE